VSRIRRACVLVREKRFAVVIATTVWEIVVICVLSWRFGSRKISKTSVEVPGRRFKVHRVAQHSAIP
jgi:hypothetical protein